MKNEIKVRYEQKGLELRGSGVKVYIWGEVEEKSRLVVRYKPGKNDG